MKNSILVFFVLLLFFVSQSHAQNFEMQMRPDSVSGLDFNFRKILASDSDLSFFSGNYDLKYRHVIGRKLNLIGGVVYSDFTAGGGGSIGGLGNAYLGAQFKGSYKENNQNAIELGVFLPISEEEGFIGALANYYDLPKYVHDSYSIRLNYQSFYDYSNGFSLGYELGPDLLLSTDEFSEDDMELTLRYGLNLSYNISGFRIMSELLGVAALTESGDFGERTIHSYAIGINYEIGHVAPRLFYKDYFDEDPGDAIDGILGIGLFIKLN